MTERSHVPISLRALPLSLTCRVGGVCRLARYGGAPVGYSEVREPGGKCGRGETGCLIITASLSPSLLSLSP